jgi:RNA polymerase sigma-70 factor (TIGR02943 family)
MNTVTDSVTSVGHESPASCDWVEAYGDYLFNFALGQAHDSNIAEDLVQETFLAAWKARERFAGKSAERTWLVGILRHKIYDHLRQTCRERNRRVQPPAERADEDVWENTALWLHDVAAECQSPSRRMELDEFRTHLECALGELPPRLAQVFQLYAIEERPNPEVCHRLNISESNLWVMLHRARQQLREQLGSWWNGEASRQRTTESEK